MEPFQTNIKTAAISKTPFGAPLAKTVMIEVKHYC